MLARCRLYRSPVKFNGFFRLIDRFIFVGLYTWWKSYVTDSDPRRINNFINESYVTPYTINPFMKVILTKYSILALLNLKINFN